MLFFLPMKIPNKRVLICRHIVSISVLEEGARHVREMTRFDQYTAPMHHGDAPRCGFTSVLERPHARFNCSRKPTGQVSRRAVTFIAWNRITVSHMSTAKLKRALRFITTTINPMHAAAVSATQNRAHRRPRYARGSSQLRRRDVLGQELYTLDVLLEVEHLRLRCNASVLALGKGYFRLFHVLSQFVARCGMSRIVLSAFQRFNLFPELLCLRGAFLISKSGLHARVLGSLQGTVHDITDHCVLVFRQAYWLRSTVNEPGLASWRRLV